MWYETAHQTRYRAAGGGGRCRGLLEHCGARLVHHRDFGARLSRPRDERRKWVDGLVWPEVRHGDQPQYQGQRHAAGQCRTLNLRVGDGIAVGFTGTFCVISIDPPDMLAFYEIPTPPNWLFLHAVKPGRGALVARGSCNAQYAVTIVVL